MIDVVFEKEQSNDDIRDVMLFAQVGALPRKGDRVMVKFPNDKHKKT